jgi:hypothetical protein
MAVLSIEQPLGTDVFFGDEVVIAVTIVPMTLMSVIVVSMREIAP